LRALKKITKEIGALLIVDEIITGFGRTGRTFNFQKEEIIPDILLIGKGMGNGIPISAVITSEDIASVSSLSKPSGLSSSFGGNPFSLRAAQLSLDIIKEENLIENANNVGRLFLDKMQKEFSEYSFVGDIHGEGLMLAIELVEGKKLKTPLNQKVVAKLFDLSLENGIIGSFRSSHLRINPPLIFSEENIDEAISKIKVCFDQLSKDIKI
jgi:4-aminobutyrate aminotransferase-like enzyme